MGPDRMWGVCGMCRMDAKTSYDAGGCVMAVAQGARGREVASTCIRRQPKSPTLSWPLALFATPASSPHVGNARRASKRAGWRNSGRGWFSSFQNPICLAGEVRLVGAACRCGCRKTLLGPAVARPKNASLLAPQLGDKPCTALSDSHRPLPVPVLGN